MNRTLVRAFEILDYASQYPTSGVLLKDICEKMDLSKSTAHVIVQTLLALGYLETLANNDKRYVLGSSAYILGMKYLNKKDFISSIAPELQKLCEKWKKTGFVGVLKGGYIVYVHKYTPSSSIISSCPLGSQKSAYATGLGKAFIAFSKNEEEIISQMDFVKISEKTITDKDAFRKELQDIRSRGYAIDDRENDKLLSCVAVPVFDHSGYPVASMSLTGLYDENEDMKLLAKDLVEASRKISRILGYIGPYGESL